MTLSIKNGGYAFLIRLDLMFSMSLWKEFQLLQILNDLSIRHLIKLILYENDVKALILYRSICDMFNKPKFYWRYIDDILAAFDNEQDALNF